MSSAFLRFCCKLSMKIIFYLPVNTGKPKFVAFLVFVCMTASFTCLQVRLQTLLEQQLFDGCGAQPFKFVSNAEGSVCQFLEPFFFSGIQKVGYCYFCPVRFHFFSFSSALFPKGWLAAFFLPARTTIQVTCGTPSTCVALAASCRLNHFVLVFCFAEKKNDLEKSCPKSKVEVLLLVLCVCCRLRTYM